MAKHKGIASATTTSKAEVAAAVEAIGHLHHMLGVVTGSLTTAKHAARAMLNNAHALPGGVPREAAVAFAKLRLEVAHNDALTLETLRSIVEAIPVPELELALRSRNAGIKTVDRVIPPGMEDMTGVD